MTRAYYSPVTWPEALHLKAQLGATARIIAGGTDLLLEMERGVRLTPDGTSLTLIDLTRIPGLARIQAQGDRITLGPLVTHNQCVKSALVGERAFPLARACWEVGAPQIRNRATVVGNIVTASPANDTITPLLAMDATVTLASAARGERSLSLERFITGFRKVDSAPDEIVSQIEIPAMTPRQRGVFIKLGLRRAQAISIVNVAIVLTRSGDDPSDPTERAAISLGAVAPQVVRAHSAEAYLRGRHLDDATLTTAARLALEVATPIDDVRATAFYRSAMVETLVLRALRQLRDGRERAGWARAPVLLWGGSAGGRPEPSSDFGVPENSLVNGVPVRLTGGATLLHSLREAGYVGVKEGCGEGECGACTIFLDGMAVMACMVPAEQAAGSRVDTVEGLGSGQRLHRVQRAFVESGGVQCGFCTPGFIMSAVKLLEERARPTRQEVEEALTGNLCRCTGYRKIVDAVLWASTL